jgi:hypothetical protein
MTHRTVQMPLLILLFCILTGGPAIRGARATSFAPVPFPSRVSESELIVRAVAGKSAGEWVASPGGGRRIYTYTEMRAVEIIKEPAGAPLRSKEFKVREMGGTRDGVGMQVSGTAEFSPGEEVILMLGPANEDGSHDVRGMMMGKYRIEKDSEGQEVLRGAGLGGIDSHEVQAFHGTHGTQGTWTLDRLKKLVVDQAAGRGQAAGAGQSQAGGVPAPPQAPALQPGGGASVQQGAPALAKGAEGDDQDRGSSRALLIVLAAAGLAAAGWLVLRARRR